MTKKTDKVQDLENEQSSSALQSKINELEAQVKRAVADYHNLEKRITEGRSELTKWGTNELLMKLLPTLDHLEQALTGASETEKESGWVKGVDLAVKEFKNVLQSEGLNEIQSSGQFDPNLHEAVDIREGEDNKILKVVRRGYTLNGKVLRPAQVVVGKSSFAKASEDKTENLPGGETQSDMNIPPDQEEK